MNKVIWWIIGIVIILGLIWYVATKKPTPTDDTNNVSSSSQDAGGQRSLVELLALGTAQKCTFNQSVDGSNNEGRFYLSNGKMRGDFSSMANGQTMTAHMISDGQDMYTWLDGLNMGFKMSMDSTQAPVPGAAANGSVDVNQKLDYDCVPWTAEAAQFTLPAGVQFNDMSTAGVMMPPLP